MSSKSRQSPQTSLPSSASSASPMMCMAPGIQPRGNSFAQEVLQQQGSSEYSSGGYTPQGTGPATTPTGGGGGASPTTDQILADYQVQDDTMTEYEPWGPASLLTDPKEMTQTEADLLSELQTRKGLLGLYDFREVVNGSFETSEALYGGEGSWAGHQDAFRHMYWNALMTREFGEEFAEAFATAHEGKPGNMADDEAMDLYNNSIGRRIAIENPDATTEELQQLIQEAVTNGEAVVIDENGELVFSDEVAIGETGVPDDAPVGSTNAPPDWDPGY